MQKITDEQLVENFRAGDKTATEVLLTRFKPLVKAKAKAFYVAGGDPEDLIQEGMIGLYKAVLDFDFAKNDSFAAFASLCVVRQLQTAIKTAGRRKHTPLNESLSLDNAAEESDTYQLPASRASDPETLLLGREALRDTQAFIRHNLSALEQTVLSHHTHGKSHAEIAELTGKNKKAIDNALLRIRKKLGKIKGDM
jgi:RNA polymerase sporulation-specific sigma factor